jgi:hypothetical protein
MASTLQTPFDVAVIIATIVRPTLAQAMRSVYAQRFDGRVQLLLGVDQWTGERALVEQVARGCPSHMAVTVMDLGYSTSQRHGGLYPSSFGGALRTILSYAANSRHITYLDDDNWVAPDHLASLRAAVQGKDWAFALRVLVDDASSEELCVDRWESVGPGRGVFRVAQGGFVDANCYLIDKLACHDAFTAWAVPPFKGGTGGDRKLFQKVRERPWGATNVASVYYRVRLPQQHTYTLWQMKCAGVDLARYMAPQDIPGDDVWRQCAAFDRGEITGAPAGAGAEVAQRAV